MPPIKRKKYLFQTKIDKLLKIIPHLGRIFSFLLGIIEVPMLELFRLTEKFTRIHILEVVDTYILKKRWGGHVIPLNVNFHPETKFLPSQEIFKLVSRSNVVGIGNCYCRLTYKNCDNPIRTCIHISFGQSLYEIPYKSENFKRVSKQEIFELLEDCDQRGLVHQLIYFPNPSFYYIVCNCCPCCCVILSKFIKSGSPQIIKSDFIAKTDLSKCKSCGNCEQWCYFGARKIEGNRFLFEGIKCFGCGLCISKCPENAIILIRKNN